MTNDNPELQAYLARPLPDLMAELSLYDEATRGPGDTWQKIAAPIRRRICDEWGWCTLRQDARFENKYDLALALVTALSVRAFHIPLDVDAVLVAAILVKLGLDAFCDCP
jgi:hypothetical protein